MIFLFGGGIITSSKNIILEEDADRRIWRSYLQQITEN